MIPRYSPTYTWDDLRAAARLARHSHSPERLRARLGELYGRKRVFLFNGASVALYALLRAYARPGAVLMPAYTCIEVPEAVCHAGYRPVFADIDPETLNMTAQGIQRAITADTTVILVTHQFGIPPDMDEIIRVCDRFPALLVEDAAAAMGATFRGRLVGTFGPAAILSFHRTKVVSADVGGALMTNDDLLAERVRDLRRSELFPSSFCKPFLRSAAWKAAMCPALYTGVRLAYRLTHGEQMVQLVRARASCPARFFCDCSPLSAALLSVQLDRLAEQVEQRRRLADVYRAELEGTCLRPPKVPGGSAPAWIQMPVRVHDKERFYHHMLASGVDLSWNFRYSCAESYGQSGCTEARRAAETVLGLPTYPTLSDAQLAAVCRGLRSFVSHHGRDSWQSQSERRVGDCVDSR